MARPLYMKIVTEIQGVVHAAQLCFATITAICQTNAPAAAHLLIIASTNRIDRLRPPGGIISGLKGHTMTTYTRRKRRPSPFLEWCIEMAATFCLVFFIGLEAFIK